MGARMSRTTDAYDKGRAEHQRELGCFGVLSRVACQAIIASILVAIAVLSIISLVYRSDRWAVYWDNASTGQASYKFHAGWGAFDSTYSRGGYQSLLNFNFGCWVIGWICFAFQLACLVFAVIQFVVAVSNQSGRHTCAFGVPLGIATVCVMAAYILAFIVETREYSFLTTPNRGRYTPWPGFAWITGTISGALWVVAGSAAFCMPHKHPKALPTTASTATTPTAAGTPAATAAPERRSWFGRDRRAGADLGPAAAGVGAGTAAGAYAGENKYGAYPGHDVEAGRTAGAAGAPGYNGSPTGAGTGYSTTGTGGGTGYGTTGTGYGTTPGYGTTTGAGADPTLAGEAPSAVPGQKRRGGFMSLVGLGKNKGSEGAAAPASTAGYGGTGAGMGASAPPPPAGSYEQPTGASSAWHTAGHGLSGAPTPAT